MIDFVDKCLFSESLPRIKIAHDYWALGGYAYEWEEGAKYEPSYTVIRLIGNFTVKGCSNGIYLTGWDFNAYKAPVTTTYTDITSDRVPIGDLLKLAKKSPEIKSMYKNDRRYFEKTVNFINNLHNSNDRIDYLKKKGFKVTDYRGYR